MADISEEDARIKAEEAIAIDKKKDEIKKAEAAPKSEEEVNYEQKKKEAQARKELISLEETEKTRKTPEELELTKTLNLETAREKAAEALAKRKTPEELELERTQRIQEARQKALEANTKTKTPEELELERKRRIEEARQKASQALTNEEVDLATNQRIQEARQKAQGANIKNKVLTSYPGKSALLDAERAKLEQQALIPKIDLAERQAALQAQQNQNIKNQQNLEYNKKELAGLKTNKTIEQIKKVANAFPGYTSAENIQRLVLQSQPGAHVPGIAYSPTELAQLGEVERYKAELQAALPKDYGTNALQATGGIAYTNAPNTITQAVGGYQYPLNPNPVVAPRENPILEIAGGTSQQRFAMEAENPTERVTLLKEIGGTTPYTTAPEPTYYPSIPLPPPQVQVPPQVIYTTPESETFPVNPVTVVPAPSVIKPVVQPTINALQPAVSIPIQTPAIPVAEAQSEKLPEIKEKAELPEFKVPKIKNVAKTIIKAHQVSEYKPKQINAVTTSTGSGKKSKQQYKPKHESRGKPAPRGRPNARQAKDRERYALSHPGSKNYQKYTKQKMQG